MDRDIQYRFFIVIAVLSLISIVLSIGLVITIGPTVSEFLTNFSLSTGSIAGIETKQEDVSLGTYQVIKVVDGDTFWIDYNGVDEKVRLIGIDTPESKDPRSPKECFSQEASDYLYELIYNKNVRIAFDPSQGERDRYGRLLVYAWVDDVFINETLIREGYAFEYTYNLPYQYQVEFQEAEEYAQKNNSGLWGNICEFWKTY